MEPFHPAVGLAMDRTQDSRETPFTFVLRQDYLDCVTQGDVHTLETLLARDRGASRQYFSQALPVRGSFPQTLVFLCGCFLMAACAGGLPLERGAALSTLYWNRAPQVEDLPGFLQTLEDMERDFAQEVCHHRRFQFGHEGVNRCARYIYEHVTQPLSLGQVAAACGYSLSWLQHLFVRYTGQTLTAYIRREKMARACLLLRHTQSTCLDISQKLSFSSQSHFIRQFKQTTGMTPAQYRRHSPGGPVPF